jgi:hypothetical protein
MISKRRTMYTTGQSIHPVQSIFGAGYVPELHAEDEHLKLPAIERDTHFSDFVKSLRMLVGGADTTTIR